ncbi:sodium-dependent transporter [Candidatus Dependentiae bacterium]|nr:sodium-dependent transporter [Candidatus Dependentiae bacterium]
MKREHWDSRTLFILAAVGSAVGLGNVWRFPFVCYQNGGGAFFIPFFVAILTAGIPLLILEMGLGHMMQAGAPTAMFKINKKFEWLGWFSILVGFGIVVYYAVIMSWCFNYLYFSFGVKWAGQAGDFFFKDFLQLGKVSEMLSIGSVRIPILGGLFLTWLWIYFSIFKGAKSVGKVVLLTVPLPFLILIFLVIRGLTLPGAMEGVKFYLEPDFSKLLSLKTWLAAYGQVFFSFSIGFGVMIAYASFLPKKTDVANNAFIVGLVDALTAFLSGFAVFSALGFLSLKTGVAIDSISGGVGLAFVTFPTIIEQMPKLPVLAGLLFFIMLLTLGIDSAFSLVEAGAAGLMDKYKIKRVTANTLICSIAFILGLIFTTQSGVHWLTILDYFSSNYGLVLVGLFQCIAIGWVFGTGKFRRYINSVSEVRIGIWWDIFIAFFTPVFLIISLSVTIFKIFTDYENTDLAGYELKAVMLGGVLILLLFLIASIILGSKHQKLSKDDEKEHNKLLEILKRGPEDKLTLKQILMDLGILLIMLFGVGILTFLLIQFLPGWIAMLSVAIIFLVGGLIYCLSKIKSQSYDDTSDNNIQEPEYE